MAIGKRGTPAPRGPQWAFITRGMCIPCFSRQSGIRETVWTVPTHCSDEARFALYTGMVSHAPPAPRDGAGIHKGHVLV